MKVYVAGPYSTGDVMLNIRAAVEAADQLVARGHIPYVPHVTGMWHLVSPRPYQWWLSYDEVWLRCCDAVLRLEGESAGADAEVLLAKRLYMPVYYGIDELPVEVAPF